ncbi:hypothetical protein FKM82_005461 [Ascaphus truei]
MMSSADNEQGVSQVGIVGEQGKVSVYRIQVGQCWDVEYGDQSRMYSAGRVQQGGAGRVQQRGAGRVQQGAKS